MTVKELKDKLHGCGNDWEVFMVTDLSDENWDDEECRWRKAHSIDHVTREKNYTETLGDFDIERCIVLVATE